MPVRACDVPVDALGALLVPEAASAVPPTPSVAARTTNGTARVLRLSFSNMMCSISWWGMTSTKIDGSDEPSVSRSVAQGTRVSALICRSSTWRIVMHMFLLRSSRTVACVALLVLVAGLCANAIDPVAVVDGVGVLAVVGALVVLAVEVPALLGERADRDDPRS